MKRLLPVVFLCISLICFAQIEGIVVKVSDGDTFTLLSDGRKLKIRLSAIDCPEATQRYDSDAANLLKRKIEGKKVSIDSITTDRYKRIVGVVHYKGQNLNELLLRKGLAWHYKQYDKSDNFTRYDKIEQKARKRNKGLWKDKNPVPAWEYRKSKHKSNSS